MQSTAAGGAAPENEIHYSVVRNHEEQYSMWPLGETVPKGWQEMGVTGSREQCGAYIEEVWTDLRPLSLRVIR
jgi:MbtH protein